MLPLFLPLEMQILQAHIGSLRRQPQHAGMWWASPLSRAVDMNSVVWFPPSPNVYRALLCPTPEKGHTRNVIKMHLSWVWWHRPAGPGLGRLRKESQEFKISLSYTAWVTWGLISKPQTQTKPKPKCPFGFSEHTVGPAFHPGTLLTFRINIIFRTIYQVGVLDFIGRVA